MAPHAPPFADHPALAMRSGDGRQDGLVGKATPRRGRGIDSAGRTPAFLPGVGPKLGVIGQSVSLQLLRDG